MPWRVKCDRSAPINVASAADWAQSDAVSRPHMAGCYKCRASM